MRSALVPILLADPMPWAFKAPYAWDFLKDRARFAGGYKGALANTPGWTATPATHSAGGVLYASTASGALQSFASGELRRTDKGVLIEGARTNLCLYSADFSQSNWSKTNVTLTANAIAAPNGTLTATKVEVATTAATSFYQQNLIVAATTATASIFVKSGNNGASDCDDFIIRNVTTATNIAGGKFDWTTGIFTSSVGGTATVSTLANGWYRITISISSGITSGDNLRWNFPAVGNTETAGIFFYLWGAQLEAAAFPSSYIPTTTASATRAADVLTVPVSGLDYPLTLYAEFERAVDTASTEALVYLYVNGNNYSRLSVASTDAGQMNVGSGGVTQANLLSAATISVGTVSRLAGRIASNDAIVALNGVLTSADASVTVPVGTMGLYFGADGVGATPCFGYLRRAAIWNRALTDAELQAVTT